MNKPFPEIAAYLSDKCSKIDKLILIKKRKVLDLPFESMLEKIIFQQLLS